MVIDIVVNVLEEEQQRELEADPEHVSTKQLHQEIQDLKALIQQQDRSGK